MLLIDKIAVHCNDKRFSKVKREVAKNTFESNEGFIVDYSNDFIVLQEIDDFVIRGFLIIPIKTIIEIRRNNKDKYFENIYKKEGITEEIKKKHNIDLTNWETIFKSIKKLDFNVIIKNENPEDDTFDIGPIVKITKKSVFIRYFDAMGVLDDDLTNISWDVITLVNFDDIYINILSKYLKIKKVNK
jgi:hypothetical protein